MVVGGLVTKSCSTLSSPGTVCLQAPLSIGFSRQEYWSGLPLPSLTCSLWSRRTWGFLGRYRPWHLFSSTGGVPFSAARGRCCYTELGSQLENGEDFCSELWRNGLDLTWFCGTQMGKSCFGPSCPKRAIRKLRSWRARKHFFHVVITLWCIQT